MFKTTLVKSMCFLLVIGIADAQAQKTYDRNWLISQIKQHPDIITAQAQWQSDNFQAKDNEQPLYNPNVISEYEREGSTNNYLVGINQSIDRNNKRQTFQQLAQSQRINAQLNYTNALRTKLSEALLAINQWHTLRQQSDLLIKQEEQLESLLKLVKQRTKSGDLGQLDAELAYLSLSQGFGQTANILSELNKSEAQLQELLPEWRVEMDVQSLLVSELSLSESTKLAEHPLLKAAYSQWQIAQSNAELARKNKKADPSFGINVGKVNKDNLVSLNFSMPLNIRRNFDSAYLASEQQALVAESNYHSVKRKQRFAIQASYNALKTFEERYYKWQKLMQGRDENSESLLQKQWRLGDISTTNYLLTLQQRTQGLLAGIELKQQYKAATINYLTDIAQLGINDSLEVSK